jgi:archaellum component FlaC
MVNHSTRYRSKKGWIMKVLCLFAVFLSVVLFPNHKAQAFANSPACAHGTTLLSNDLHAWQSLYNQSARLYKNIKEIRNDINSVIEIEEDVKKAKKTAADIQKVTEALVPVFELVPEVQSGLEHTGKAAGIAHKNVLTPIYDVAHGLVEDAKLREIRKTLDTEVLPRVAKFEKFTSDTQARVLRVTHDFTETCHLAEIAKTETCSTAGFKVVTGVYDVFKAPITEGTTAIIELSNTLSSINRLLEDVLNPAFEPMAVIKGPVDDITKALRVVHHDIYLFERELDKRITIKLGPPLPELRFTVNHILKEWKKEVKKLEHLVDIDALKRKVRHEIDHLLHPLIHRMTGFIYRLESGVKIDGFSASDIAADLSKLRSRMAVEMPIFDFNVYDVASRNLSAGSSQTKSCR